MEIRQGSNAAQPRPAFGLRPWFALLRRARSFRRFAFAIAGRVPVAVWYRRPLLIAVSWGAWRVDGVLVAASFGQRLVGIHGRGISGLLLSAVSVHGGGLDEPLQILHLSEFGAVVGHDVLGSGGRVRARAHWLLEVPIGAAPPPIGARLRVLPSSQG